MCVCVCVCVCVCEVTDTLLLLPPYLDLDMPPTEE